MSHKFRTFSARLRRTLFVCAALIAVGGTIVPAFRPAPVSAACGSGCVASMSASPGSGSYNSGATITVSVVVNSAGQSINAVQADFTYVSSRLEYVGGSAAGVNGWTTYISNVSGGSGSVVVGKTAGAATSGAVISMQFKALSNAGAGSISFSGSSSVVSSSSNQDILGSTSGASYTIVVPTPPPATPVTQPTSQPPAQQGPTPSSGTNKKPAPTSSQTSSTPQSTPETTTPTTTSDKTDTDTTPVKDTAKAAPVKKSNSWLMPALIIGGIVVVGAGGAGAWLLLRRRNSIMPVTSGSVPTSDFITGPGSSMPPVQPMAPPQDGASPTDEIGGRPDSFPKP